MPRRNAPSFHLKIAQTAYQQAKAGILTGKSATDPQYTDGDSAAAIRA